jgi:hypothetical protein
MQIQGKPTNERERKQLMKTCKPVLRVLSFVLAFAFAGIAADDPTLTFKFKDPINVPKAYQTEPEGVNDAGVLVGTYWDNSSQSHGFLLAGKKLTKLDDPKASKDTTRRIRTPRV